MSYMPHNFKSTVVSAFYSNEEMKLSLNPMSLFYRIVLWPVYSYMFLMNQRVTGKPQ